MVARVCLTFGTTFLVIAFFMEIGFMMGVMTISFAYQMIYASLFEIHKMVSLLQIFFKKIPIY